jgi:hypothetical protein
MLVGVWLFELVLNVFELSGGGPLGIARYTTKATANIPSRNQGRRLVLRIVVESWVALPRGESVTILRGNSSVGIISVGDSVLRAVELDTVGCGSVGADRKAPSARQKFSDSSV